MKISKLFVNTLLTFTSIFLGILFCELAGRKLGLGKPILYKPDTLVGYRLKPNQSVIRMRNSKIKTDFEGFRISNKKLFDKDSSFIVFVGDSVTYGGSYIDNNNLFTSKYCDLILDQNIRCLNNGINAWGIHNMSRFISNYDLYSSRKPLKFILVILPGDEGRNLKAFSDTPFWNKKPKQPSAFIEILKFVILKYFIPSLESNNKKISNTVDLIENDKVWVQKKIVWDELKFALRRSKYPVDVIITPPKRWFESKSFEREILNYEQFLDNLSKVYQVKKTCNLYRSLKNNYKNSLYTDGVHLSKEGHELWAKKIFECIK